MNIGLRSSLLLMQPTPMKSRIKYKEDVDVGRTCLLKAFKNLYGKVFSIVIIQKKIRIMKLSEDIVGAKIKSS